MKQSITHTLLALTLAVGATACARTVEGVVTDTRQNTQAVRGGIETLDVKAAIIADDTIDAGAIDVDTYQDTKTVVLRGSVATQAEKNKAGRIAAEHAKGYKIDNQIVVAD